MTGRAADSWVRVGTLDDLWVGEMLGLDVGGRLVVLMNVEGEVVAFEDRCPHQATRLSDGTFDGRTLVCSAHQWVFDCRGGTGINPSDACLLRFAARVDDDAIFVNVDEVMQRARGLPGVGRRP